MARTTLQRTFDPRRGVRVLALGVVLCGLAAPAWAGATPAGASCARAGDPNACRRVVSIPQTVHGRLESAAGTDDVALTVRTNAGGKVVAYCDRQCGDWFAPSGQGAGVALRPALRGRRVTVDVAHEHNGGRVAGAAADASLLFVKRIRLQK